MCHSLLIIPNSLFIISVDQAEYGFNRRGFFASFGWRRM